LGDSGVMHETIRNVHVKRTGWTTVHFVAIPRRWYAEMGCPRSVVLRFDPATKTLTVAPADSGGCADGGDGQRGASAPGEAQPRWGADGARRVQRGLNRIADAVHQGGKA